MPVQVNCVRCGKQFNVSPSYAGQKFCSNLCRRSKRTALICLTCHCTFYVTSSEVNRQYCSLKCCYLNRSNVKQNYKKRLRKKPYVYATCQTCQKIFEVKGRLSQRFCSRKCNYEAHKKLVKCKNCNCTNTFLVGTASKKQYCSYQCFQQTLSQSITLMCQNPDCKKTFTVCASANYYKFCSSYCRNLCSNSGNVKWYSYIDQRGNTHRVQGGYELAYISFLDESGVSFKAHPCMITYHDDENKLRKYFPGFKVADQFVDVKNDWLLASEKTKRKFENLRKSNPDLKISILNKDDLNSLGITIPLTEQQRIQLASKNLNG